MLTRLVGRWYWLELMQVELSSAQWLIIPNHFVEVNALG